MLSRLMGAEAARYSGLVSLFRSLKGASSSVVRATGGSAKARVVIPRRASPVRRLAEKFMAVLFVGSFSFGVEVKVVVMGPWTNPRRVLSWKMAPVPRVL